MKNFLYKGAQTKEISFPLGGIGSGSIGLAGNGSLIDWEIFNKPNKGSRNGFSHFAVKAESKGKLMDARVLNGDLPAPYSGNGIKGYAGFGFGPERETMAGLPHFRETTFHGEYPFAKIDFKDSKFPGRVSLKAFNPLIPLNDKDSSLPVACFEIEITNTTKETIDYTSAFTVKNPLQGKKTVDQFKRSGKLSSIVFQDLEHKKDDPAYGDLTMATDGAQVSWQEYWYRGSWFDNLGIYWRNFTATGRFKNRRYEPKTSEGNDHGVLAVHLKARPHQTVTARFIITWSFPNCTNYWNPEKCKGPKCDCKDQKPKVWKNYYATLFRDSQASAQYTLSNWDRLKKETGLFHKTLFSSTLPAEVLDAVSANISILRTPTTLRLEDGSFYGWEGCHGNAGCCEGTCTHVWNYAYAMPFLFPKLERSIRELDYRYNMNDNGGMVFRLQLPVGRQRGTFRPCADGQLCGILKMYREWKISGDTTWLRRHWKGIKKNIEFAWEPTNTDLWDPKKTGVLSGRQHHTLDMELFGPNSWLTGFYLGALKAGAEMAEALDDMKAAEEYRLIFTKGKDWMEKNLFNGQYYFQKVRLNDQKTLTPYQTKTDKLANYWSAEHKELKYQIGEGCGIDQVLAQWHANIIGLGDIFDKRNVKKALRSIYKYNYKGSFYDFANFCRLYSLNDEAGTVMFEWPDGTHKPAVPIPYAEETMTGFEHQVACHMIQEGMVKEGLELVRAIRNRFDGERRNPWNEFECGSNYARAMASYALLNALSGFEFDMPKRHIGFSPVRTQKGVFRCFWSLDSGWGEIEMDSSKATLRLLQGSLELNSISLSICRNNRKVRAFLAGQNVACENNDGNIMFKRTVLIKAGKALIIKT